MRDGAKAAYEKAKRDAANEAARIGGLHPQSANVDECATCLRNIAADRYISALEQTLEIAAETDLARQTVQKRRTRMRAKADLDA